MNTSMTAMNALTASLRNALANPGQNITTSGEANEMSGQSAQDAMEFSSEEAAALRAWQEQMWLQTSAFNAQEAQKARDWQERMSNTAYQRAVADMRAAGLNPILAFTQGGASTPGGSTASVGTMNGAMGTGYTYQAMQEASAGLKVFDIIAQSALSALDTFTKSINESKSFKNWLNEITGGKREGSFNGGGFGGKKR